MLQKQSNNLQALSKKRVDAEEMAKVLQKLPESERRVILHMVQGILLVHNAEQREAC